MDSQKLDRKTFVFNVLIVINWTLNAVFVVLLILHFTYHDIRNDDLLFGLILLAILRVVTSIFKNKVER